MADSAASPACTLCGGPLDNRDIDSGTCHDCRSPRGKVADLDIAIRASGDDPERIRDWPIFRHLLRKRFGEDRSDTRLWERFTDWLRAERRLTPDGYLNLPLDDAIHLLADDSNFPGARSDKAAYAVGRPEGEAEPMKPAEKTDKPFGKDERRAESMGKANESLVEVRWDVVLDAIDAILALREVIEDIFTEGEATDRA
ncbi:MAG: hypothetical protein ABI614_14460, partial [Planctomycetota bacterium]